MTAYENELMNNQSGLIPTLERAKEKMQDDIIKKYGLEVDETIIFCAQSAETSTKPQYRELQIAYDTLML